MKFPFNSVAVGVAQCRENRQTIESCPSIIRVYSTFTNSNICKSIRTVCKLCRVYILSESAGYLLKPLRQLTKCCNSYYRSQIVRTSALIIKLQLSAHLSYARWQFIKQSSDIRRGLIFREENVNNSRRSAL